LVETDVTVAHEEDFEELLLREIFREEHYQILLCLPLEGDSLQAENLIRDRVGNDEKPGDLLKLGEV